jgi:hypothetical protein
MSIYQIAGLVMIVILAVACVVYIYIDASNFSKKKNK